jgi:adenosylcobinamide-phosphate synthase
MLIFVICISFALDLIIGDPHKLPHPVRGIGKLIEIGENLLRRTPFNEKTAGVLLVLSIVFTVFMLAHFIIWVSSTLSPSLSVIASIILIFFSISAKQLCIEGIKVYLYLETNQIENARNQLKNLVGRDTHNLTNPEIIRATIESLAENLTDGIIAPLFYSFIGGAPLAVTYRAINTLDSMVGYKDKKYKNFGWASAKLDDIINFIPARISSLCICLSSFLLKRDLKHTIRIFIRDRRNHPSPNSGYTQSAMAGALGVRLGGKSYYNSKVVIKPYIGDSTRNIISSDIKTSVKLIYLSSFIFLFLGCLFYYIFSVFLKSFISV